MAISTTTTTRRHRRRRSKYKSGRNHHGQWTIDAEDHDENKKRFEGAGRLQEETEERHQKKDPDHTPIIFNEGDTLTFTCRSHSSSPSAQKRMRSWTQFPVRRTTRLDGTTLRTVEAGGSVFGVVIEIVWSQGAGLLQVPWLGEGERFKSSGRSGRVLR